MFDIAPSEFLLVAIVALVVIGPKDLPKAMRLLGYWVGKARGVARQFRSGFDNMVREAELVEMEKKWASENERIMKEHGAETGDEPVPSARPEPDLLPDAVIVQKPVVESATHDHVDVADPTAAPKAPS